jgi:hypothetical protein
MDKSGELKRLSYESDGKMGKEQNKEKKGKKQSLDRDFFNITPNSE